MRITDSRYDRDRHRLTVAYRLIGHEARTQTIRQATGLSGDRIRKLYRDYLKGQPAEPVRRRRGKSPRQMSFFWRSPAHELQKQPAADRDWDPDVRPGQQGLAGSHRGKRELLKQQRHASHVVGTPGTGACGGSVCADLLEPRQFHLDAGALSRPGQETVPLPEL